jgi:hypothetical protein
MEIIDGTGSGKRAKVDQTNRLETFSIIETRIADVSVNKGNSFVLSSDFITLTNTASFNSIFYLKSISSDKIIFIDKIRICGTGNTMGYVQTKLIKTPTGGTLITDEAAAIVQPSNLGASTDFEGLAYKGADNKTATGGDQFSQFTVHLPGHTIQEYNGALVLTGGTSFAIDVKPSYTTEICIEIQCWVEDKKI